MTDIVQSQLQRTTEIGKLETATLPTLFKALGCGLNGYDLQVKEHFEWALKDAEKAYWDKMKTAHPDMGGDSNTAAFFNLAIKRIRNIATGRGVILRSIETVEHEPKPPRKPPMTAAERQRRRVAKLSMSARRKMWRDAYYRRCRITCSNNS